MASDTLRMISQRLLWIGLVVVIVSTVVVSVVYPGKYIQAEAIKLHIHIHNRLWMYMCYNQWAKRQAFWVA